MPSTNAHSNVTHETETVPSDLEKKGHLHEQEQDHYNGPYDVAVPVPDEGKEALPAGTFDPVYEAKCRVLNRAVRLAVERTADA